MNIMNVKIRLLFALLGLLLEAKLIDCEPFTITKFEVPPHVQLHANVELTCEHDLKPGRLFQLQWRLQDQEFYRFSARGEKKLAIEKIGLDVNLTASSETRVVIMNVNLTATGEFKCMVISEGDFEEISKSSNVTVIVIPTTKPVIEPPPSEGLRPGSMVDLNCTSSPSIPAAELEWHLNDKTVPQSHLRRHPPELQEDGLFVSRLGLHFKLDRKDYSNGELKLRCTAKISTFYTKSDQREHTHRSSMNSAVGEPPAEPAIGGSLLKANGGTSLSLWCGYWIVLLVLGLAPR